MELVDTHCHPFFEKLAAEPKRVLSDAQAAGVTRLVVVGTSLEDSQKALDYVAQHGNTWASVGVHPHSAREFLRYDDAALKLRSMINNPGVAAVGEIGLDYYRNYSTAEEQKAALITQIEEGLPSGLPFIFHIRDSWQDFWPIFDSYTGLNGVVHSFSAGPSELEDILKRGLYVGLNGIMTFTKDPGQLEAAKRVPLERLLLETDAPFLTPAPHRGKICEPKHILDIAKFLSELRGEPLEKLASATTQNATKLFGLR